MAGITKNFVIKNGLEVNGGLFIVNTDNDKVGVGTSVLNYDFNVRGGIGVTNAVVTGITTVNEFESTFSQLGIATATEYRVGSTTALGTVGGLVSVIGIQTVDSVTRQTLQTNIFGQTVQITNLDITGVGTFANKVDIGGKLDVDGQGEFDDINVAGVSTFVGIATYQNTLFGTQLSVSGISTLSSAVVGSNVTLSSGGINVVGVITGTSAIVGSAVTLTSGGIEVGIVTATNINSTQITPVNLDVSGIATVTSLTVTDNSILSRVVVGSSITMHSGGMDVTGVTTFASHVKIFNQDQGGGLFAGIITAANGGQPVVYFGDGSNLTGVSALPNLGISTAGGFVGAGVTLLKFLGGGISTVFTNFTSGIATIFIEGGSQPGGSTGQIQFNSAGALAGSANLTFDGTAVGVGTIILNGSGISAGIITGTSFSGSGSGITGLTNSNLSGTAGITNANLANSTISGISLGGTLGTLTLATSGTGLSGSASYTGATGQTFTVTSNAASANTASAIVARNAAGGFVAGIITAGTFSGNVVGNISASGISTLSSVIIGSATTITSGGVNAVGIVSATSYTTKGSGSYQIGGIDVINSSRQVEKVVLDNYAEKHYAFGNTGTAPTIDLSNGTFVTATLTGNATFAFSLGTGVTSDAISFTLHLANDATAGRTITWPASVKWPNATVPTRTTTASKTDVYTFYTFNGGTTWYGNLSIYNYS
jgi:hypothetical protein